MSVRDPRAWMPADMISADKDYFVAQHPDDPHAAAAEAWEAWASAMTEDDSVAVTHVSTGAQSITYAANGSSPMSAALDRARYHRARAKIKSVIVGPTYTTSGNYSDGNNPT